MMSPRSLFAQVDDGSFELWNTLRYTHPFKDSGFTYYISSDSRFRNEYLSLYLINVQTGFLYQTASFLAAGFSYRYQTTRGPSDFDDFADENRLMPEADILFHIGPIQFIDRNIFELRFFEHDPFRFRYRNRLWGQHLFEAKPVSYTPFIADEFFVEPGYGGFDENRLMAGNIFGFNKNRINWSLYYLLRQVKAAPGSWPSTQVLGTLLEFRY